MKIPGAKRRGFSMSFWQDHISYGFKIDDFAEKRPNKNNDFAGKHQNKIDDFAEIQ